MGYGHAPGVNTQPLAGSQVSLVHGSLSSHFLATSEHLPVEGLHVFNWQAVFCDSSHLTTVAGLTVQL